MPPTGPFRLFPLLSLFPVLSFLSVPAESSSFRAIDLYRSRVLSLSQAQTAVSEALKKYETIPPRGRVASPKGRALRRTMGRKLAAFREIAFARVEESQYLNSSGLQSYLVFDVVDVTEAAARLDFLPSPRRSLIRKENPAAASLFGLWERYAASGEKLLKSGRISREPGNCAGYLCRYGKESPALTRLETLIQKKVPALESALIRALRQDPRPRRREEAAYLLAFLKDGELVARLMGETLRDPDGGVRGAGLEVFSQMAFLRPALAARAIPLSRVAKALDDPLFVNRSKALAVFVGLARNPARRRELTQLSSPFLLLLLRMREPGNHDLAYALLTLLSGKFYEPHDYAAWGGWLKEFKELRFKKPQKGGADEFKQNN